jgi:NADH-quinone oxidoreductase subunit L
MFAAASTSFWLGKIGLLVAFWYLMVHAFAKATLFLVAGHLIHVTHSRFCEGDLELGKKMKIGFGATIIATTFLAGIPPLTAYWVKSGMDELMVELIHDVGALPLILLIAVSVVYAAFLAKFLSLNFIKGTRPHHIDLHGGQLMSSAYAIMVSLMFVLLYVIIREIDPSTSTFFEAGLEKTSFLVGIAVLITYSGGLIMPRIRALANVGFVLSDRLYLPFLNDYIIPGIGWVIASIVDHANRGIDSLFHRWVPEFFERISRDIRKLQTGSLPIYIQIVSGIIIAILIIGALMGWR